MTFENLAFLYYNSRQFYESKKMYKTSLDIWRRLFEENPRQYRSKYALCLSNLSFLAIITRKFSEAEIYIREAFKIDDTQVTMYTNLAASLLFQGKYEQAEQIYRQYKRELKESFLGDFDEFDNSNIIPREYQVDVDRIKKMLNE